MSDWLSTEDLSKKIREIDFTQYKELEQSIKEFEDKIVQTMDAMRNVITAKCCCCQQEVEAAETRIIVTREDTEMSQIAASTPPPIPNLNRPI